MHRTPVTSSNVASVGYDAEDRTLQVEFRNGGVYEYYGVPDAEYRALMRAESIGGYLNTAIKPRYRWRQVHN